MAGGVRGDSRYDYKDFSLKGSTKYQLDIRVTNSEDSLVILREYLFYLHLVCNTGKGKNWHFNTLTM